MTESELGWHFWYFWQKSLFRTFKRSLAESSSPYRVENHSNICTRLDQNIPVGGRNKWLDGRVGWSTKGSVNKWRLFRWFGVHQSKQGTGSIANAVTPNLSSHYLQILLQSSTQSLQLLYTRCDSGLDANTFVNRLRDTRPDWVVNKRGLMPCAGARRRDGT